MSTELYKHYRPKSLKEIVGQKNAVKILTNYLQKGNLPHTLLISGDTGTGKSSIAYILKEELGCLDIDFHKMNASDYRGIDNIREIRRDMLLSPLGKSRIWLIEEAHGLTRSAMDCFLDYLEFTPEKVYFILASTEPQKLLSTVRSRCTEIKLTRISDKDLFSLLTKVVTQEKISTYEEVLEKIVSISEGSARKALVKLENIMQLGSEEEQLGALDKDFEESTTKELCQALLKPHATWSEVSSILKKLEEDPEKVRYQVLGYMTSVLLGGGKFASRANVVIRFFRDDWTECGRAGLVSSCWEILQLS